MRTLTFLAAALAVGCSFTTDFEAPFPGAAVADGLSPEGGPRDAAADADAQPMDRGLDAQPMDAQPMDAQPMDAQPPDTEPPDAGRPADAAPDAVEDALAPDVGPPCDDEGAVRAERCGPAGGTAWVRERCVDEAWRAGDCAVQPPFACGAQTFTFVDGEPVQKARYVYLPNLQGRTRFHTVEATLRTRCDGCIGAAPIRADGVFDLDVQLETYDGGLADTQSVRRGQPLMDALISWFAYRGDRVEERVLDAQSGAFQRLDVHRVQGQPSFITETFQGVTEAEPQGVARLEYNYGPFDELRTVITVAANRVRGHRRYHYGDQGEWVRLDIREGDAAGPLQTQFFFDATCLDCDDAGCRYDVPPGCTHVPLRLGPDGFQGGWPSALCDDGLGHASARQRCAAWGGTLARFDTRFDQEWVAQVAGPDVRIRVDGVVDDSGIPRWAATEGQIPEALMGGGRIAEGDCLALAPDGRLAPVDCEPDVPEALHFLCERRAD